MFDYLFHNLAIVKLLKVRDIRKLPWRVWWRFFLLMQNEKLTFLDGKIFINSFLPFFPSRAAETYLSRIGKIAKGEFGPQVAILSVTNACAYKCNFCYNRFFSGKELSLGEIKTVLAELKELGVHRISISGGEPLLRVDLPEIISSISSESVKLLNTTGYGLNQEKIAQFKKAGLDILKISLDDSEKDKVDRSRNFKGAFENAIRAIKMGREAGLYVVAAKIITKNMLYSERKTQDFLDFVEGAGAHEVVIYEPKPSGGLIKSEKELFSQSDREKLFSLQIKINRCRQKKIKVFVFCYYEHERCFGCNAGSGYLSIDATGNVSPCAYLGLSFGNVRENSLKKIYSEMKTMMPEPRSYCAAIFLNKEMRKHFKDKLPLEPKIAKEIISKLKKGILPLEYKKIKNIFKL